MKTREEDPLFKVTGLSRCLPLHNIRDGIQRCAWIVFNKLPTLRQLQTPIALFAIVSHPYLAPCASRRFHRTDLAVGEGRCRKGMSLVAVLTSRLWGREKGCPSENYSHTGNRTDLLVVRVCYTQDKGLVRSPALVGGREW
jgi:hypothetical protein